VLRQALKFVYRVLYRMNPTMADAMRRRILHGQSIKKRIRGVNNRLQFGSSILHRVTIDIEGSQNAVHICESYLNGVTFHIRGCNHRIVIGRGCRFVHGGMIWFEDDGCQLVVGEGSSFENVEIAVAEPHSMVRIGGDCMFAYDIDIRTTDSHSVLDATTGQRINHAQSVCIGDHVWVGAHSVILKGVSIADNSIVAAGAVVCSGSAHQGVILAGNPAKVVREGVTWARARIPASSQLPPGTVEASSALSAGHGDSRAPSAGSSTQPDL